MNLLETVNGVERLNSVDNDRTIEQTCIPHRDLVRVLVAERVKILAYIDSMIRDEELAEDLFQEVCVLAVEKSASILDETHLVKWLRTTARFNALNAIQKRNKRSLTLPESVLDRLESKWQQRDGAQSSDRADALRHCEELLPARTKELLRKRFVEGISYEQLAKGVGRPVNSLYVTFSRIFTSLGNCVMDRLASLQEHRR
jgi:RNA polymerase sigma-70 factor (ECF subfamily)